MSWGSSPESIAKRRAYDRAAKRKAYQANPEKFKARTRGRRAESPALLAAQGRTRYAANPEKYRQQKRASRARDRAADRTASRGWALRYPVRAWARQQRGRGVPATAEAVTYVEQIWHDPCAYCGRRMARMTIDHIVPVAAGGQSVPENLTRACLRCNDQKHDNPLFVFLSYCGEPTKREDATRYLRRKRALAPPEG